MARTLIALLVAVPMTLAVMTPPAYGWGDVGHMMVAFVAYQDLTGTAQGRVNALVRRNPKFSEWQKMVPKGTSKADRNMMLFMIAATWPDQIKGDPDYTSDGSHNGNRPEGSPDPSANRGYADKLMHKYWHFVDLPFSTDDTKLPAIPTPNAQERIKLFRGVLASNAKDPLKSYDLVWLLHLVGDVHQPLHCVTRVSAADTDGDDGGNGVKILCEGCPPVLHSFWDGAAGSGRGAEAIAPAIAGGKNLPKADPMAVAKSDAKDWIDESFELAKTKVYQSPIEAGSGPFMLTPEYEGMARSVAEERIALAGARLARLLNKELK